MPFDNSLKAMQTPERLYALCRLVHQMPLSQNELKEMVQPSTLNQKQDQFTEVLKLAKRGDLIELDPQTNQYRSKLQDEQLDDLETFKAEIAKRVFSSTNYIFTQFTCWFLNRGEEVLTMKNGDLARQFFQEVTLDGNIEYNTTNITAWKQWAVFLGLGYQYSGVFVPNAANRIQILLKNQTMFPLRQPIPFRQFINWLANEAPELDGGKVNMEFNRYFQEQQLSYALSSGLRTLHSLGMIYLNYIADATDVWHLTLNQMHEIPNQVSQIELRIGG
ncbi:hypothetical protein SAMN06265361_10878 [Laceyella tengchongensis]|uniref:Uncharacterized protein n=1 Tax=Laceyella tengchongensis TaxID=574699 RepID=A0AA46AGW0_9BACL|nr:hypothetical protein [Laceyella tengchongensis]SMP32005.1 hypothetical protein SAMN06265361_10878 [Laceyella tengchongensis]HWO98999.1 hypothetical protein [Bacillus sp. (in: firmicutes)]